MVGITNLTTPIGIDTRMETRADPHKARIKTLTCPHGAVSAIDPTSPGAGTGDLVPSVAHLKEAATKINNHCLSYISKTAECTDFLHKSAFDDSSRS